MTLGLDAVLRSTGAPTPSHVAVRAYSPDGTSFLVRTWRARPVRIVVDEEPDGWRLGVELEDAAGVRSFHYEPDRFAGYATALLESLRRWRFATASRTVVVGEIPPT
jgi:hypothetical protein